MDFKSRFESKVRWLRSLPNIYIVEASIEPPIQEATISQLHERLGFALDARFLDYFRACNGWSLRWLYAHSPPSDLEAELAQLVASGQRGSYGRFSVAGLLASTGAAGRDPRIVGGPHSLRFLGGITDQALRDGSYEIAAYGSIPSADLTMTQYTDVLLHASATRPDPICYISSDYYADLSNFRPMRARSFFELGLAYLGNSDLLDWFEGKGFDGDHALIELEQPELPAALFYCEQDKLGRASASLTYLKVLGKRAGLAREQDAGDELPELPVVHPYRESYPNESDLPLTTGALLAAVRELAIFEIEEHGSEVIRLLSPSPHHQNGSAYLRVWPYVEACRPEDYPYESLRICYREAAPIIDELRSAFIGLGLRSRPPATIEGDAAGFCEDYTYPDNLAVARILEPVRALGFTHDVDVPVSWSTKFKNLRIFDPTASATVWVELGPLGPARVEGEFKLEAAELRFDDDFPAESVDKVRARLQTLGLVRRAWRLE